MKSAQKYFGLLALILLVNLWSCNSVSKQKKPPYVLVVSLDGFRWDYPEKASTPTLDSLATTGVRAQSLIPSFPTKTFPNHYSIATGLYPDHHGLVLNGFYAPDLDKYYATSNRESVENPDFYGGEPIWVTAEKQGMTTASFFWVGSEAPVEGIQPTYWKKYQHHFPFEQRVDSVVSWFDKPYQERPRLVMLYFHEPDHLGHLYGPDSDTVAKEVSYLDHLMGTLCHKLNRLSIADSLDIIILSDHGMHAFDHYVFLDDYIDTSWFEQIQGWNPNYVFKAKPGYYDTAFAVLKKIPGIEVWKHGQLPERLHYGNNPRTLDFIAVAKPHYGLMFSWDYKKGVGNGAHGYDNSFQDMHAIFYASGPSFKKNYASPSFENVNIYALLADILQLKAAKTDGKLDNVKQMLK